MRCATPLVLLPGLDGSGSLFEPFVAAAAPHFPVQVLSYDEAPDQSYARLAASLAPALPRDRPFVLVAESFGGPLALHLSIAVPERVTAVVLVNSFVRRPSTWAQGRALLALAPVLGRPPAWAVRKFMLGEGAPAALVQAVQQAIGQVPAAVLRARLSTLCACDEVQTYLRSMAPIYYLHGTEDRLLGRGALELLEYVRPGLVVERIAAPHLLLQRRPSEALTCLRRFLLEDRSHA